jgi:hypothetical protein
MKHIRQHVAQRKVVWANKIVVTTIKFISTSATSAKKMIGNYK